MASVQRLRLDAAECIRLSQLSSSENIRLFLTKEAERLSQVANAELAKEGDRSAKSQQNTYTVKITNYGWDQSDKFVKLYLTLNGVQALPAENVISSFQTKSVEVNVMGLDGKNHSLVIKNLLSPVKPEESYHKVKTDMVVVFLKKSKMENWSCVTEAEQKTREIKTPKIEEDADPSQSLMNLMKQMYENGDDDMKRNISKAWTEAREKKSEL